MQTTKRSLTTRQPPSATRPARTRRSAQLLGLLLVISLLTTSTPAAPPLIAGRFGEVWQEMRFAFLVHSAAGERQSWLGLQFGQGLNAVTTATQPVPTRLALFPGTITLRQGATAVFAAVGFDAQNAPVDGLPIQWQVADTGRGLASRARPDGKFQARLPGTFTITATGGGLQTQAVVTVTPAPPIVNPTQASFAGSGGATFSSRSGFRPGAMEAKSKSKLPDNDGGTTQNSLPSDGGWNDGNAISADDPGNGTGNPTGHAMDGGAGSGNFQLSAPVLALPGRGIDLALNANYNSRVWNKAGSQMTFDIDRGFPAPGWSLGFGKLEDMGANSGSMLVDADGTRHGYAGTPSPPNGGYSSFSGHTTDGKFIDYFSGRSSSGGIYYGYARLANGTSVIYGAPGSGSVYPTLIVDANGNYLTVTYVNNQGPNIQTITDTLGRLIIFNYDVYHHLIAIQAPRMEEPNGGGSRTRTLVQFHYRQLPLNYSFAAGTTVNVYSGTVDVPDAIYYPATHTGYWFGDSDSYSSYGMLSKVVEQRGMNWSPSADEQGSIAAGTMSKQAVYNYPLTAANETGRTSGLNLSDAPTYETLTETWDGMDGGTPAVTAYKVQAEATPRLTTVIQPNGAVSRQFAYHHTGQYDDGVVYRDETYIPSAGGVTLPEVGGTYKLVGQSNVTWEPGEYDSARPLTAKIIDENNQKVSTEYQYGGGRFNQLRRSCDYDDGHNQLRCANADYENSTAYIGSNALTGRHIFNLVKSTSVSSPDGTRVSQTDYEYDNYTTPLADTPGVVMHNETYNPYTTATQDGPNCLQYVQDDPYDSSTIRCIEYDQISAYNPQTALRGNITKTTTYSNAANLSGAIDETRSYDIDGNAVTASTACCQQTSRQYTSATQYAYPVSQTRGSADPQSADRITTATVFDGRTGLLLQSTDANGRTTTTYNSDTLRPAVTTTATGATIAFTYDEAAMTVTEETRAADGTLADKNIKYLNGLGQVRKEEAVGPGNVSDFVETKYNQFGELWKQSRPYRAGDTPQYTETVYDLQGRVTQTIAPDGSTTQAFYNETTRPASASALPGNTVRVADAWGRERWGRYDQQGRLAEVVEPDPANAADDGTVLHGDATRTLVTNYNYDTLNRLTETVQGDQHRLFRYDSLGRLTRQKLAEQTATLADNGGYVGAGAAGAAWSAAFVYDNRSNLVQKTDARGVRTNYSYTKPDTSEDPLNRLQAVSYDLSGPLAPGNILTAPTVTYQYMTTGDKARLSQIRTAGLLTETLAYDGEGRVQSDTQTVDGRGATPMVTSYFYDTLDRMSEVWYPQAWGATVNTVSNPRKVVHHNYDTTSRLTSLTVDGQQQAGDIVYNAADQTTAINIGTAGTNQVTENYTFDPQTGLLTNQKVVRNGTNLLDLSYDYARNNSSGTLNGKTGQLTQITNNLDGNKNRAYRYDSLSRLKTAQGGANIWQQQYSYDRYGNKTNVAATGVAADNSSMPRDGIPNLTYNSQTNQITTAGYQYDVAGNLTRSLADDGVTWLRYTYDAANRLQIIQQDDGTNLEAYQFGASNERLLKYDYLANQTTVYAGNLMEYTESSPAVMVWTKSNLYLGDSLFATATPNGASGETVEYHHPDRLGTRLITNQATGGYYEQNTLPFGTALNAESSGNTSKRFTSYERSARTGLDYAVNRSYDSKLGRFTQVDPIGMSAVSLTSPQTLNLYNYCGNDPINHTDPDGLFFGGLFRLIGKVFRVVNSILKYVVIAVAIVTVVLAVFVSGGAALSFLSVIGGVLGKLNGILNFVNITSAGVIDGIGSGGSIAAGLYGVGAVANSFRAKNNDEKSFYSSKYAKYLAKCIWLVFGKDSNLLKEQRIRNSPSIDEDPNLWSQDIAGQSKPGDESVGKNGQVHIASKMEGVTKTDAKTNKQYKISLRELKQRTYVHELGNKLNRDIIKKIRGRSWSKHS